MQSSASVVKCNAVQLIASAIKSRFGQVQVQPSAMQCSCVGTTKSKGRQEQGQCSQVQCSAEAVKGKLSAVKCKTCVRAVMCKCSKCKCSQVHVQLSASHMQVQPSVSAVKCKCSQVQCSVVICKCHQERVRSSASAAKCNAMQSCRYHQVQG